MRAEVRMLKYACSVIGNLKQVSTRKNFLRVCIFFIRLRVIFYANVYIRVLNKS